jgi:hypothetical protein
MSYQPFPAFADWDVQFDARVVDQYAERLRQTKEAATPQAQRRALEIATRYAAVDTGALEGLYTTDRGFTRTIATQSEFWQRALALKGEQTQRSIEDALAAYDYVLDAVTGSVPMTEKWIKELHAVMTEHQATSIMKLGFLGLERVHTVLGDEADRQGRGYKDILVTEHGEFGPVMQWRSRRPKSLRDNRSVLDGSDEYVATFKGMVRPPFTPSSRPHITERIRRHILERHRDTPEKLWPGKPKFPKSWSGEQIMDAVDQVLLAPDRIVQRGDRYQFSALVNGFRVGVVVRTDKPNPFIWTAYPERG